MQYLYHKEAGASQISLLGDFHHYLFKVRRHRAGETIYLRNLTDQLLYSYHIEQLDKKMALLQKREQRELRIEAKRPLHIGWCVIDPKSIEKMLPSLNEIGVGKITFIYCARSQKSFGIDFDRLKKIVINSSQQCGRSVMMVLDEAKSFAAFLAQNPDSWMLDFSDKVIGESKECIETILIGAEGGFSDEERSLMAPQKIIGLDTPLILKSESAVCAVASNLLL